MTNLTLRALLPAVALLATSPARAQPAPPGPDAPPALEPPADPAREIDDAVAFALLQRGKLLFDKGDHAGAKVMFIESLERSPKGASAEEALKMLRASNAKLGIKDADHGSPFGKPVGGGGPADPYGDGSDGPQDPYGGDGGGPADPYAGGGGGGPGDPAGGPGTGVPPGPVDQPSPAIARRRLIGFGALYGAVLGMAVAGPEDSEGNAGGGAVLGAIGGAGAGALAAWWVTRRRDLTPGQGQAIISGGTWGTYTIAMLGDAFSGVGSSTTNDIFKSMAIGGALGVGGGYLWSRRNPSEADVSLVNSFGAYGSIAGLQLGAVIQPPESEAYSINAAVGALGGLAVGMLAANRWEVSRRRMLRIDLGTLGGAAVTWAVLYPALADDTTNDDEQAAGLISLFAMAGGAYLGYRFTRNMDRAPVNPTTPTDPATLPPPADSEEEDFGSTAGLFERARTGRWALGVPMPRPVHNPALGPRIGSSFGVDLLAGRF